MFHVVTRIQSSAARQSGNFRQMVSDTYFFYRTKIPNQNFRNFFINGKQTRYVTGFSSFKTVRHKRRTQLRQVVTFSKLWICENALGFILAFPILTCLTELNIFLVQYFLIYYPKTVFFWGERGTRISLHISVEMNI